MLYNNSNKQIYKLLKLNFCINSGIIIIINYHNYYENKSILFLYYFGSTFLKVDYTGLNTLLPSTVSSVAIRSGSIFGFLRAALKLSLS